MFVRRTVVEGTAAAGPGPTLCGMCIGGACRGGLVLRERPATIRRPRPLGNFHYAVSFDCLVFDLLVNYGSRRCRMDPCIGILRTCSLLPTLLCGAPQGGCHRHVVLCSAVLLWEVVFVVDALPLAAAVFSGIDLVP